MRILHVVDSRQLRGAEIFASDLIRALNESDVAQLVAVLPHGHDRAVEYEAPTHSLEPDGWSVPGLHFKPRALWALRDMIRRWRPDVIQAHGGQSHKYTMFASIPRRAPVVYRKIGLTPPDVIGGLKRAAHGYLMRRTSRIVAVGESVRRETIEAFRVSPERVITIANAVDPGRMKMVRGAEVTRRVLGIPPSSPVMLSLGALTWEKDPLAHVEIGARVLRLLPEAVHLMVGDGPLLTEVETSIRRQRMNGRVRLLPATRNVPDLLGMSDVLLLASRTEGMPACLIEAGMMGTPVAAYAIAGVPEVIVDGVTGRLTSPGDTEGLAATLLELLSDPETSRALGAAAREHCRLRFDIREIAPRYLKLYEELEAS